MDNLKINQMETNEKIDYDQLGRMATIKMPELIKEIREKYTPTLTDQSHIPEICRRVISTYPELDQFDRNVLITACVYSLYSPATLIGAANAPANMRKAIAEVLGYENGTNINYWQNKASSFIKSQRYVKKVESITNQFKNHD